MESHLREGAWNCRVCLADRARTFEFVLDVVCIQDTATILLLLLDYYNATPYSFKSLLSENKVYCILVTTKVELVHPGGTCLNSVEEHWCEWRGNEFSIGKQPSHPRKIDKRQK